jgi:hypothetical protein
MTWREPVNQSIAFGGSKRKSVAIPSQLSKRRFELYFFISTLSVLFSFTRVIVELFVLVHFFVVVVFFVGCF